jgi:asparagine synthase (glutamine-hydrolysing)
MCGFAGVISGTRNYGVSEVKRFADEVAFRGPDKCGVSVMTGQLSDSDAGTNALFFNRLAIVDLDARSNQPFTDDRYLLLFNGEIYNYKALREELKSHGHVFRTASDTEVLFYSFVTWGDEALKKLNGMFSLCWIDRHTKRFVLARDRMGIKPLYYAITNGSLYYGSELHSILRFSGSDFSLSPEAVEMYLWLQFVPTPYSIFNGILKLPPGSYIAGNIDRINSNLKPVVYWDAYTAAAQASKIEGTLEAALKNSLERQLQADVPLGLFLSSGVDSSLLAAMVNKYFSATGDMNFFSVSFSENTASDESSDAADFIKGFNNPSMRCITINVDPEYIRSQLDQMYSYFDEPFGDPAALLNWAVAKKAREYVTVALSGDGADELFWGYPRYERWKSFEKINKVPIASTLIAGTANALPSSSLSNNMLFVAENDPVKRHFNFFLPSGMRFKIRNRIERFPLWALEGIEKIKGRTDFTALLDLKTYLADAMLYKVDRASMATSLEVRVPYLDNEVVDFSLHQPFNEKSNNEFRHKACLKRLLFSLAPHYDTSRPKKGFSFPLNKWLRNEWRNNVLSTVTKTSLESVGLDPQKYLKLVNDYYASKNNFFTDVWYIYNLIHWHNSIKKIH